MTHIPTKNSTKGGVICGGSFFKKTVAPPSTLIANQIVGITSPIKKKIVDEFKGMGLLQKLATLPIIKKIRKDDNIKFIF